MRSHYLELNVDSLMKDKKLEANLSMVASRVMAGLNMNGLKYLLPLWLGALTGVTIRCVFAAVAFWLTGCFIKEAAVTRKQRIMLFCLGAFGLYGFMFCYLLGISKYNPQIQISAESETKRSIFREKDKTKRSKKESAQHSKSRNKSFVMTSVSAL